MTQREGRGAWRTRDSNGIEKRASIPSASRSGTLSDLSRKCGRRWNCYLTSLYQREPLPLPPFLSLSVALHAPTGNQTSLLSTRRMRVLRCWSFARLLEIIIPRIYTPGCINDSYVRLPMLHASENSFGRARGCLLLLFEHATLPLFYLFQSHSSLSSSPFSLPSSFWLRYLFFFYSIRIFNSNY